MPLPRFSEFTLRILVGGGAKVQASPGEVDHIPVMVTIQPLLSLRSCRESFKQHDGVRHLVLE